MLQPRAARTAGSCWRGLDIVWILCADHVFWYPWLLSTSVYRRASACCRVHRASVCRVIRGTSTSRDRGASTSGRVHCASACRAIRGTSISRDRGAAAPAPVVEYIAPAPAVSYVAPAPAVIAAPASVVEYIT